MKHSIEVTKLEWRPIKGYEDLYSVSENGDVMRTRAGRGTRIGWILKPHPNHKGYLRVNLLRDGKTKEGKLHKLVAEVFCTKPVGANQVNHKDCNKLNNHYSNLEWTTGKQNVRHAMDNNLRWYWGKLSDEQVTEMRRLHEQDGLGSRKLCKMFNVSRGTAQSIIKYRHRKETGIVDLGGRFACVK